VEITPLESWIASKLHLTVPLSVPQLQEYQLGKLQETLKHAVLRSRFYKEHLRGIDPASIRSMKDVARLPFTTPEMPVEEPNDFLCVSPKGISRIVTLSTSGTTGRLKRIAFTPEGARSSL
jgi:phenylacetate-CoA ligase